MSGRAADVIRGMLVDSASIVPTESDGGQILSLIAAGGEITVTEVPPGSVAIKLGSSFPKLGRFLSRGRLSLLADYAVIGERDGLKFIVCLEAGLVSLSRDETENRMKGAVCAVDYCASLALEFLSEPDLFEGARRYFVKVRPRGLVRKRFNYKSRLVENGSPEKTRVVVGDSFPFSYLVSEPKP
jgi:hypothetical protein